MDEHVREIVDRRIEVRGTFGWLYFRRLDDGRVHVTAAQEDSHAGPPVPLVGLGEFTPESIRDALDQL